MQFITIYPVPNLVAKLNSYEHMQLFNSVNINSCENFFSYNSISYNSSEKKQNMKKPDM